MASRRCQRVGETVDTPAFITPTATKCKGTRGLPERTCRQTARREGGWCILLSAGRQQSGKEVVLRFAVLAIIGAAFAQEYRGTILCRRPSDCENASPRALRYSFLNSRVFEIRHTKELARRQNCSFLRPLLLPSAPLCIPCGVLLLPCFRFRPAESLPLATARAVGFGVYLAQAMSVRLLMGWG